jgi:hypothetical protein
MQAISAMLKDGLKFVRTSHHGPLSSHLLKFSIYYFTLIILQTIIEFTNKTELNPWQVHLETNFNSPSSIESKFRQPPRLLPLTTKAVSDTGMKIGYICRTGTYLELWPDPKPTHYCRLIRLPNVSFYQYPSA